MDEGTASPYASNESYDEPKFDEPSILGRDSGCSKPVKGCSICLSILLILGLLSLSLGLSILFGFPVLFRHLVSCQLPIKNGSETFTAWQASPVPIAMQFWFFSVENPKEVVGGAKPMLKQLGPFGYSESRQKVSVSFNDNSTVAYKEVRKFVFEPKLSCQTCAESTRVTTVNLAYFGVAYMLRLHPALLMLANPVFEINNEGAFVEKTVKELLWGYEDKVLKELSMVAKLVKFKINPVVGLFAGKNLSDDGVYNVFTGSSDIDRLVVIDRWQGMLQLPYWSTESANSINGTDGTLFPPFVEKSRRLYLFSSDICRSIYLTYTKPSSLHGVDLMHFTAPPDVFLNASLNPDNLGFCTDGVCLDSGVLNMSTCQQGAPAISSQPHFYQGAEKYIDSVVGLQPSDDFATELHVEPNTGVVMRAAKKLQVNVVIDAYPHMKESEKMHQLFAPIMWINESAVIDEATADEFKSSVLLPLKLAEVGQWCFVALGVVCLLAGCLLCFAKRRADGSGFSRFENEDTAVN